MGRRPSDLDQTIDEHSWLKEHPIYCPVSWCKAHDSRYLRCGDAHGDYDGIHRARLAYVAQWNRLERRRVAFYRGLGLAKPEIAAGMGRALQDSIDQGLTKGRQGRRGA